MAVEPFNVSLNPGQLDKSLLAGGLGLWRMSWTKDYHLMLDCSNAISAITGQKYPDGPIRMTQFSENFVHPDDKDLIETLLKEIMRGHGESFCYEYRLQVTPGHYKWVRIFGDASSPKNIDGTYYIFGFIHNVDEYRSAMADMAVKNRQLKLACLKMASMAEAPGHVVLPQNPEEKQVQVACNSALEGHMEDAAFNLDLLFNFITTRMTRYHAILNQLTFPLAVYDVNGNCSYINQSAADSLGGCSIETYLGSPLDWPREAYKDTKMKSAKRSDGTVNFVRRQLAKDVTFRGQSNVLRDESGHIIGRIETLVEITEAHETSQRRKIMLDTIPLACSFWDRDGNNFDTNQTAVDIFDQPDKQSFLDNFYELSPKFQPSGRLSRELVKEIVAKVFHEGFHQFEWIHKKPDGTLIPCEVTLIRAPWKDDYIVLGYTRTHDMEQQLLRNIMEASPICFMVTVGSTIKFITPFTTDFTGRKRGDDVSSIFIDDQTWERLGQKLLTKKHVSWQNVEILHADDQPRSMLLNAFHADYYGEHCIMSWFMDITELKKTREMAELSVRAKSEFLANMSHEIRTPMNAILGLTHLMMQIELSDVQTDYLQKIEGAAKTLLRIINDILDFSKIEAGKLEMEHEEFYLADVLQNIVDTVSRSAHEKGLEFLLQIPSNTPAGFIGDQIRLTQILSNLTSNAVKFTEKGQITLTVETVEEKSNKVTLRFLVQDTGIGLTAEQKKILFSAFTQADVSTTRRYGGTGLGLVISKRLVEMMNGQIWCKSTYGQGSVFGFTLSFDLHSNTKRYISKHKDFVGLSALAVDDNAVALDILRNFLKTLGFNVVTASSGREALDILSQWKKRGHNLDLVVMDWKMPEMDGIETANHINTLFSSSVIPVIIMTTAYNREDVLDIAKKSGISNVITKPLSPSSMLNVLVEVLGRGLPDKNLTSNSTPRKPLKAKRIKEFEGALVLLAEDNEVNQLVASRILRNAGFVVEVAHNGRQALEMIKSRPYQLVLMDIQMPEMDGIEATRQIRALPQFKDLPILAMTAHAMSKDRQLSLAAGMNDHINKPIDLNELFSSLAKWLPKGLKLKDGS